MFCVPKTLPVGICEQSIFPDKYMYLVYEPYLSARKHAVPADTRKCSQIRTPKNKCIFCLLFMDYFVPACTGPFRFTCLLLFPLFPALYLYISTPSWTICLHSFYCRNVELHLVIILSNLQFFSCGAAAKRGPWPSHS